MSGNKQQNLINDCFDERSKQVTETGEIENIGETDNLQFRFQDRGKYMARSERNAKEKRGGIQPGKKFRMRRWNACNQLIGISREFHIYSTIALVIELIF